MSTVAGSKHNLRDIYFWNMKMADVSENVPEWKVKCDFNQICVCVCLCAWKKKKSVLV